VTLTDSVNAANGVRDDAIASSCSSHRPGDSCTGEAIYPFFVVISSLSSFPVFDFFVAMLQWYDMAALSFTPIYRSGRRYIDLLGLSYDIHLPDEK